MQKDAIKFFFERFGLTYGDIDQLLGSALMRGGDYADLYFEYRLSNSVGIEEQTVKSATKSISQGVGVRVLIGEKTGYAYTDEITFETIKRAAETASYIANHIEGTQSVAVNATPNVHNLYAVDSPTASIELTSKIELISRGDDAARKFDKRIREVQSGLFDEIKYVMIASSDGRLTGDVQP